MSVSRENNFDFLRLMAATAVLISHCYPIFGRKSDEIFWHLTGFQTGGGIGVAIFFFMSGYLVTASIERSRDLWIYTSSRALRILPALAGVVAFSIFLVGPATTSLSLADYFGSPATWTYAGNALVFPLQWRLPGVFESAPEYGVNGSLWTLPIEVAMYVLLAAFFFSGAINRRWSLFLAVGFFAAHMLSRSVLNWSWEDRGPIIFAIPLYNLLELGVWFFIGSAVWVYRADIPVSSWFALAVLIAFVATFHSPGAQVAQFIALPYLVHYVAHCPVPLRRITAPIGDISYGVYLYAWPVQQTVYQLASGSLGFHSMMALSLVITYALGFLSWHLLERDVLTLKPRRLAKAP